MSHTNTHTHTHTHNLGRTERGERRRKSRDRRGTTAHKHTHTHIHTHTHAISPPTCSSSSHATLAGEWLDKIILVLPICSHFIITLLVSMSLNFSSGALSHSITHTKISMQGEPTQQRRGSAEAFFVSGHPEKSAKEAYLLVGWKNRMTQKILLASESVSRHERVYSIFRMRLLKHIRFNLTLITDLLTVLAHWRSGTGGGFTDFSMKFINIFTIVFIIGLTPFLCKHILLNISSSWPLKVRFFILGRI